MTPFPPLTDKRILMPAETALALGILREIDLLRLKTLARLYARGLPPEVSWEDLLQEALTRLLMGARRAPAEVNAIAFVAQVMRSLKSEHWRRSLRKERAVRRLRGGREEDEWPVEPYDPAANPERSLMAQQQVLAIRRLFVDDAIALGIIEGLGEGLSAEEIRVGLGLTRTDYDSARRRMRRTLLREGLTCGEV